MFVRTVVEDGGDSVVAAIVEGRGREILHKGPGGHKDGDAAPAPLPVKYVPS